MKRNIIYLFLIIILYFKVNSYCIDFSEKCSPGLTYWYYYFFDKGALRDKVYEAGAETLIVRGPDADSVFADKLIPPDSMVNITPHIKVRYGDMPDTVIIRAIKDIYECDSSNVIYIKDAPYIEAELVFEGDMNNLVGLGVTPRYRSLSHLTVVIPLSILPDLDTLTGVQSISCPGPRIQPIRNITANNPESLKQKTRRDKADSSEFIYDEKGLIKRFRWAPVDTSHIHDEVSYFITTNGSFDQLDSLGIKIRGKHGNTVVAYFPRYMIKIIKSLESVVQMRPNRSIRINLNDRH
jgi:hypothetical protein